MDLDRRPVVAPMTGDAEIGAGERDYPDLRVAMWFLDLGFSARPSAGPLLKLL